LTEEDENIMHEQLQRDLDLYGECWIRTTYCTVGGIERERVAPEDIIYKDSSESRLRARNNAERRIKSARDKINELISAEVTKALLFEPVGRVHTIWTTPRPEALPNNAEMAKIRETIEKIRNETDEDRTKRRQYAALSENEVTSGYQAMSMETKERMTGQHDAMLRQLGFRSKAEHEAMKARQAPVASAHDQVWEREYLCEFKHADANQPGDVEITPLTPLEIPSEKVFGTIERRLMTRQEAVRRYPDAVDSIFKAQYADHEPYREMTMEAMSFARLMKPIPPRLAQLLKGECPKKMRAYAEAMGIEEPRVTALVARC
jgi:hypothetical protein